MSGSILLVDDVATNRIVLKARLGSACYDTRQAGTGAEALAAALARPPDLILLDLCLPDMTGEEVCRRLKADPATRAVPVLAMAHAPDPESRRAALRAGADDLLVRPLDEVVLLARLRSLLRAREQEEELRGGAVRAQITGFAEPAAAFEAPGTVALVAPTLPAAMAWRRALAPHLRARLLLLAPEAALADDQPVPDAYLIAAQIAAPGDGLRLLSELHARPSTRHASVCVVLSDIRGSEAAMALDLGASDLLDAAFDAEEAALRLAAQLARKRRRDRLREGVRDGLRLAVTDSLTGLHNRRYAFPHLAEIAARAHETGTRFAVMVLDIDRLKAINDTYGHRAGDAVLAETAARLQANLRDCDMLARIGGDEFLVAMPDTSLGAARMAAERLCRAAESAPVPLPDGSGAIHITLSIGIAVEDAGPPATEPPHPGQAVERADRALLAAKAAGRNRVSISARAA